MHENQGSLHFPSLYLPFPKPSLLIFLQNNPLTHPIFPFDYLFIPYSIFFFFFMNLTRIKKKKTSNFSPSLCRKPLAKEKKWALIVNFLLITYWPHLSYISYFFPLLFLISPLLCQREKMSIYSQFLLITYWPHLSYISYFAPLLFLFINFTPFF